MEGATSLQASLWRTLGCFRCMHNPPFIRFLLCIYLFFHDSLKNSRRVCILSFIIDWEVNVVRIQQKKVYIRCIINFHDWLRNYYSFVCNLSWSVDKYWWLKTQQNKVHAHQRAPNIFVSKETEWVLITQ